MIATVEVVTVWAPRAGHEQWREDYLDLMQLQAQTAARFGHKHTVMTDAEDITDLPSYSIVHRVKLPPSLMHALLTGVITRLQMEAPAPKRHLVFVDVDVLIGRSLLPAFDTRFDIGLTRRVNDKSPINNGVMYVNRTGMFTAIQFFQRAYNICEEHWGGDQEAISAVAAPVPEEDGVADRWFGRIAFLSMRDYNCVPKSAGSEHMHRPYAIHFKGDTKAWAREYAERYLIG